MDYDEKCRNLSESLAPCFKMRITPVFREKPVEILFCKKQLIAFPGMTYMVSLFRIGMFLA